MKLRVMDTMGKLHIISVDSNHQKRIHTLLSEAGLFIPAPCGGKGTCGHCRVQVIAGSLPVTDKDERFISRELLSKGVRLACQAYPTENLTLRLQNNEIRAVAAGAKVNAAKRDDSEKEFDAKNATRKSVVKQDAAEYLLAIDLGTTTLAYCLTDRKTGETIKTYTAINPQCAYGWDVMTRMEAANQGQLKELSRIIRTAVRTNMESLMAGEDFSGIKQIVMAGNTAMVHLFMGYSCEGLSKYPFTPITLDTIESDTIALQLANPKIPITIMPGLSAYVGGDIVAGLVFLHSEKAFTGKHPFLLLDLGTNAEMVLYDGADTLYVTSAPAGPAFEGGNISCGTGAVSGAISSVNIEKSGVTFETINDALAVGLCGSGLIETVYELYRNQIIDETGLLSDEYFDNGFLIENNESGEVCLTQQDIRALLMAKSAVFSAIELLLEKAALALEDVENIYLAGGFGFYLNIKKATGIGLLPSEWKHNITSLGNSSLMGCVKYVLGKGTHPIFSKNMVEITLANEKDFSDRYLKNMYLPK